MISNGRTTAAQARLMTTKRENILSDPSNVMQCLLLAVTEKAGVIFPGPQFVIFIETFQFSARCNPKLLKATA